MPSTKTTAVYSCYPTIPVATTRTAALRVRPVGQAFGCVGQVIGECGAVVAETAVCAYGHDGAARTLAFELAAKLGLSVRLR